ncbi:hypothetical protein BDF20DRAFT_842413 [Mycotypha africana]|uniref:uncharacterized protein n=1 Tax=Mycotypha africana TaxID=64632 RepID=UPI0022FFE51A|nr:uncharacterized protein BDF20DRAFT_842413 [Mycotypha africana]KAI8991057.1 hypothetical protein BDF20DRAFT_842413 [Mycotypha africana]
MRRMQRHSSVKAKSTCCIAVLRLCNTVLNRDVNAAESIFGICMFAVVNNNQRPVVIKRK